MRIKGKSGREHEIFYFNKEKGVVIQTFSEYVSQKEVFQLVLQLYDLEITKKDFRENKWKVYVVTPQLKNDEKWKGIDTREFSEKIWLYVYRKFKCRSCSKTATL